MATRCYIMPFVLVARSKARLHQCFDGLLHIPRIQSPMNQDVDLLPLVSRVNDISFSSDLRRSVSLAMAWRFRAIVSTASNGGCCPGRIGGLWHAGSLPPELLAEDLLGLKTDQKPVAGLDLALRAFCPRSRWTWARSSTSSRRRCCLPFQLVSLTLATSTSDTHL